jgi:hypothetical protein
MATDTIKRLNSQGMREKFRPLGIVDECREALSKVPRGKEGIVVGSGSNTESWKARGWKTLDLNPESHADMVLNANWMADAIPPESQDFVYAEAITMDPKGVRGASPARLLDQFNKVLKPGGKLIIQTAHFEGVPETTLPNRVQYTKLLQAHGFHGIAELGPIEHLNREEPAYTQQVTYYGEKRRAGFKTSTGEVVQPI